MKHDDSDAFPNAMIPNLCLHVPDPTTIKRQRGCFVAVCINCGCTMYAYSFVQIDPNAPHKVHMSKKQRRRNKRNGRNEVS